MSSSDPVATALASGEWKAKSDPRTGRTFYVHQHSKKSVWNLQKELQRQSASAQGKTTLDGLQADEIAAAEERAKVTREERQAKMQVRASAEIKLREEIERLEQNNQALELEVQNLRGPVQTEAAQVEELKRILADHRVSINEVEGELNVKREQKNAELLQLQNRIAILEAQLSSEDNFRETMDARYKKMTAENLELKADLSREEGVSLQLQAQIREAEIKTQQLKAKLHLQRTEIGNEEEAIKLVEDDVRTLSQTKAKLESEIGRRRRELDLAKKRRSDEKTAAQIADVHRTSSNAMKNLETVLAAREKELAQLMQADALLEKNGALERANGNLRAVLKASIRDEEALQNLAELLERENLKLAEATSLAREDKQKLETMRRQFRLKFTTSDPHGEFLAMCARWISLLQDFSAIM